jgi:hypothetical protein
MFIIFVKIVSWKFIFVACVCGQILGMEQTKNSAMVIKNLVNRPDNLMWISLAAVNTGKLKDFSGAVLRYVERVAEVRESCNDATSAV